MRWASPVLTFRRTTTREVELHGETLPAGEKIVLFYHSGNRDEDAFDDPWRFDVTRNPNRHLGFGGGGPHYCLGASLARTQLRVDVRRAAARDARHRGGRARAAAQRVHPRRQADAVRVHRSRVTVSTAPGFSRFCGSSARLIARIAPTSAGPRARSS